MMPSKIKSFGDKTKKRNSAAFGHWRLKEYSLFYLTLILSPFPICLGAGVPFCPAPLWRDRSRARPSPSHGRWRAPVETRPPRRQGHAAAARSRDQCLKWISNAYSSGEMVNGQIYEHICQRGKTWEGDIICEHTHFWYQGINVKLKNNSWRKNRSQKSLFGYNR